MTRIQRYVAKKVKKATIPTKRIKKVKPKKVKPIKITKTDIEHEKRLSGYTGKITPYIKGQLEKKARTRKMGN